MLTDERPTPSRRLFPGAFAHVMAHLVLVLTAVLAVDLSASEAGPESGAAQRTAAFEALMGDLVFAGTAERLARVNGFFNALAYRSDGETWGVEDYWSTPAELMLRGAGDCEDLAIAKYFALRRLGFAADTLRITYMRDARRDRAHMTLLYLPVVGGPLLLDRREDIPRPVALRRELVAVYGFNETLVAVGTPGGHERILPLAGRWMPDKWASVLRRQPVVIPPRPDRAAQRPL